MVLALRDALSLGAVSLTRQGLVSTPRSVFRFSPFFFPPFFEWGIMVLRGACGLKLPVCEAFTC